VVEVFRGKGAGGLLFGKLWQGSVCAFPAESKLPPARRRLGAARDCSDW